MENQDFSQFLTPGSDQSIVSGAALSVGNPAAQAFAAEYNQGGIKTNLVVPLTQIGSGNNAGMKSVVGASNVQTTQHPVSSSGNIESSANMGYETGIGWWIGFDQGIPKMFIGDESGDNMKWTGSALIITGEIDATSGMIGGFTINANSLSSTSGGNTVTLSSSGTNAFVSGPTGAPNAVIDSAGNATFIGVSTLNKKAYTNFEGSGRFVNTTTTGTSIAPTYGNQGVTIDTTGTATRWSRVLWFIANAFTNSPTFTCTVMANALNAASGDARAFVGLGQPTVDGTGITYSGNSQVGFRINKTAGVVTVASETNDGGAGTSQGANITTIVDNDILELFVKATPSSVKFYYRKNGGTITLGDTQTTHIPVNNSETSITFAASNAGTAVDFSLIFQCAAYEH